MPTPGKRESACRTSSGTHKALRRSFSSNEIQYDFIYGKLSILLLNIHFNFSIVFLLFPILCIKLILDYIECNYKTEKNDMLPGFDVIQS